VSSARPRIASPIPIRERLIVALDVPEVAEAKALVEELDDEVEFYKIGLELAATDGYFTLLEWLVAAGKRVFADLKFYDIPATVAAAVRQIGRSGAAFLTVHGDIPVVAAAAGAKGPDLKVLAVTVLTSMGAEELAQTGITLGLTELVELRARLAVQAGADGVIASGLEARALRAKLGTTPLIVTPGIRPEHARSRDDQRRVVTPSAALESGADYIVVGRPIRAAADPRRAAHKIQAEIAACLG
jgi:orotidine-5'-phosphate decarboxylase